MECRMEFLMLILCVIPMAVSSISISPNGNSPEVKMVGGMMVDVQKGFVPMTPKSVGVTPTKSNYEKSRKLNINSTKLALNERYRRLIPYMTFYYANDLATPPNGNTRNVEVEKAQIVEAKELPNQRQPKKIYYSQQNIPRYQGNRLTQYNIASANPTKIYYKNGVPVYQGPGKVTPNFNPLISDLPVYDYDSGRIVQKSHSSSTKRPYLNLYNEETPNIRYYLSEKEQSPKYKLVPYEQTPPVKVTYVQQPPVKIPYEHTPHKFNYEQTSPVKMSYNHHSVKESYEQFPVKVAYEPNPVKVSYEQPPIQVAYDHTPGKVPYEQSPVLKEAFEQSSVKAPYEAIKINYEQNLHQNENNYEPRNPVIMSVLVPKELYVKPRPIRPSFTYDSGKSHLIRKQPAVVSENYYEKQPPQTIVTEPVIEGGFKPIVKPAEYTTQAPIYTSTVSQAPVEFDYEIEKQAIPLVESSPFILETRPNHHQFKNQLPSSQSSSKQTSPSAVTLAKLLNSLQVNRSIPKPITRENVASSIRTLLQVLNTLKVTQQNDVALNRPVLSTPKPFLSANVVKVVNDPDLAVVSNSEVVDPDLHEEPYLAQVHTPSQHLDDDHPLRGGTSQQFPPPVTSDDEGGTPGHPGVDYPVLSTIPQTSFDCKSQRYKGFFADTETRCQVWHYCDLNGGQASFLCPNGTIFSQAGLTCDWWFNVRCDSTTQLYVLNESLYKYILPHSPKFPEDYSGPLVDKYLTLKFKEMEEEFKKNKSKQSNDKMDSEEEGGDSSEASSEMTKSSSEMDKRQLSDISEASVIVESPGRSGKVERLLDE